MAKRTAKPKNRQVVRNTTEGKAQAQLAAQIQNRPSFVQELKSFVDPGNLTGANQIAAAISGKGSVMSRVASGLSGVVSGVGFAYGGAKGKVAVEGVANTGVPARIVNKVTGQKVVLTGRQTAGYDYIKPAGGKYANDPNLSQYAYSYFDNPQAASSQRVGIEALPFAHGGGTLYAARGKSSNFRNQAGNKVNWDVDNVVTSQVNQKVVGSIKIEHAGLKDYSNQIISMLKRAGGKVPKKR